MRPCQCTIPGIGTMRVDAAGWKPVAPYPTGIIDMRTTTESARGSFTAEERAALHERAEEVKAATRRGSTAQKAAEAERAVLAKIAEMSEADRAIAERVHAVITASAPTLEPRLWYGMPAYALGGTVICFFQSAAVSADVATRIEHLVTRAVG
jgi:uncharacterized protein YdhG (YjbR/CyaY superfamily)